MKKDFFNGNIRREFVSYIWITILIQVFVEAGLSGLLFYCYTVGDLDQRTQNITLILAGISLLCAVFCLFGNVLVIRKYPKYPKLRRLLLNSDCYFVNCDSKEFRGHRRGIPAFNRVVQVAEQNQGFEDIQYPPKYRRYVVLTIIGVGLMFVYLAVAYIVLENMEWLPKALQNEYLIFGVLVIVLVLDIILSFVFAFRVKKIREETKAEYQKKRRKHIR